MTVKDYAKLVGVSEKTVYNDIEAGRVSFSLLVGAKRPIYDIDTHKCPKSSYIARSAGRPKGAKNKKNLLSK